MKESKFVHFSASIFILISGRNLVLFGTNMYIFGTMKKIGAKTAPFNGAFWEEFSKKNQHKSI